MGKGILALLFSLAFISATLATSCDFNVASLSDLNSILAAQTWAPSTKVLCFGPGLYSPSTTLTVTAPQQWVGAQSDTDVTCNRRPVPPCPRLQSALAQDTTKESVFNITSINLFIFEEDFSMNGFAIFSTSTSNDLFDYNSAPNIELSSNYIYTAGCSVGSINTGTFNQNFFASDGSIVQYNSGSTVSADGLLTLTNNYIFNHALFGLTSSVIATDNSFVQNEDVMFLSHSSTFQNNFFLGNGDCIVDRQGGSTIVGNTFLISDEVYEVAFSSSTPLTFHDNCIVDASVYINDPTTLVDVANSNLNNNYIGGHQLVSGNWLDGINSYLLSSAASSPVSVSSPAICPRTLFNMNVVATKPFNLLSSFHVYWSFKLGSPLIKSGLDFSFLNGSTISFSIYDEHNDASQGENSLSVTDTLNFDASGLATNDFVYTPVFSDFHTPPSHNASNNYTLEAQIYATSPFSQTHVYKAISTFTVTNHIPSVCRNRTNVITIPKSEQQNNSGVYTMSLVDLSCPISSSDWTITSIAKQPTNGQFFYSATSSVYFSFDPTKSGTSLFVFEITSVADNTLSHQLAQQIKIINTAPIAPSVNITYSDWATLNDAGSSLAAFSGASDPDGDAVWFDKIEARTNGTNLDDHTVYYYLKDFIAQVSETGVLSLFTANPNGENGRNATIGTPITTSFQHSFGIRYKVSDHDRIHSENWGLVDFQFVDAN